DRGHAAGVQALVVAAVPFRERALGTELSPLQAGGRRGRQPLIGEPLRRPRVVALALLLQPGLAEQVEDAVLRDWPVLEALPERADQRVIRHRLLVVREVGDRQRTDAIVAARDRLLEGLDGNLALRRQQALDRR